MNVSYVTTSWDDGHPEDIHIIELLERYKLRGTFYVPTDQSSIRMSNEALRRLAYTQEIGAHTIHHEHLVGLSDDRLWREVSGSKEILEQIVGCPVVMFCYPYGQYDESVREIVKRAGFRGARTTRTFVVNDRFDALEMGTTLHVFPHPYLPARLDWQTLRYTLLRNRYLAINIYHLRLSIGAFVNWVELAKRIFDYVLNNGGVWHLWGHSWEIDHFRMWNQLEQVLEYISGRREVLYLTNGELIAFLKKQNEDHCPE